MQNLNSLFQTNSLSIPQTIKFHGGKITLFKRPDSHQWQCRFKLPTGQWHQASTGKLNIDEAKSQAAIIFETAKININQGLSLGTRTFAQIARDVVNEMERTKAARKWKKTYNDYEIVLRKYLVPFFGSIEVSAINSKHIADFEAWRLTQMPSEPKGSTLRNHASAYNRVIKTARQQGYIHDNKPVPILSAVGEKGSPRPAFNKEEIEYLLDFMPEWEKGGFMPIFSDFRKLCRCYVEFLLYTGIRQGTESLPLRWLHFQWHWIGDKRYLRIWVSGKTGPRYLIARPAVIDTLNRLIQIQKLPYQNLDEVIAARLDKPIFVTHDGHKPRSFESVFRNLMNSSGLRKDVAGKFRSLYSLRHTYATFALTEGIDIHTLAKQMGTSIAMIERHYSKITPMLSAEKLAY